MTEGRTVEAPAALGISYRIHLDKEGRRELVFQGHLPITASQNLINTTCDRMRDAADRQGWIYELREAEKELQRLILTIQNLERDFLSVEELSKARWEREQRKGSWSIDRLSAQEKNAADTAQKNLSRYRQTAEDTQERIGELKALVNGHAADIGSDHHAGVPAG